MERFKDQKVENCHFNFWFYNNDWDLLNQSWMGLDLVWKYTEPDRNCIVKARRTLLDFTWFELMWENTLRCEVTLVKLRSSNPSRSCLLWCPLVISSGFSHCIVSLVHLFLLGLIFTFYCMIHVVLVYMPLSLTRLRVPWKKSQWLICLSVSTIVPDTWMSLSKCFLRE